jgi:hypothetical protein
MRSVAPPREKSRPESTQSRQEMQARTTVSQGRVKVAEKAALPPAVRKASGFPAQTVSLLPLNSAGRLSLPAGLKGLVRAGALGKAKPFRTAGGRAALGCYFSGTLTRPWTVAAANPARPCSGTAHVHPARKHGTRAERADLISQAAAVNSR